MISDSGRAPKVSVIVPVYKVEKYLERCVESILGQSWRDLDVVLVDDGSPDRCPEICDAYAKKDERIRVIHQKNGGLSSARNAGIESAEGDYVMFVDSDDYLLEDSVEGILAAARADDYPDVIITEYFSTADYDGTAYPSSLFEIPSSRAREDTIRFVFCGKSNTFPAPMYIVRRDLILANKLRFIPDRYHEDLFWTTELFALADSFSFYNRVWYVSQAEREGSIVNTVNPKRTFDMLDIVSMAHNADFMDRYGATEKRLVKTQLTRALLSSLLYYPYYSAEDRSKLCERIKQSIRVFDYAKLPRHKAFAFGLKYIGVRPTMELLARIRRIDDKNK